MAQVLAVCPQWPPPCLDVFISAAVGSGDYAVVLLTPDGPTDEQSSQLGSFDDEEGRPLVKVGVPNMAAA